MPAGMPMGDMGPMAADPSGNTGGDERSEQCPNHGAALICTSMGPCMLSVGLPSSPRGAATELTSIPSAIATTVTPLSRSVTPEPPPPRQ